MKLKLLLTIALAAFVALPAAAEEMATSADLVTSVPGVDVSKLNDQQKKTAFKIIFEENCNCGCGMTLYECRHKDQNCPRSPTLAAGIVSDLVAGKSEAEIRKGLQASTAPPKPAPGEVLSSVVKTFDLKNAPIKGPNDAPVTIVEVSDFQCPFCARAIPWVEEIVKAYPKDVRVAFKHYPLPFHQAAAMAAEVGILAHDKGKFWELHDKLFANFQSITADKLREWGKELGLDADKVERAIKDGTPNPNPDNPRMPIYTYSERLQADLDEAKANGVNGTPTFFINGKLYSGGRDLNSVKPIIDKEIEAAKKGDKGKDG